MPKVARYVDMPLQHIHENMLERMRRETSQQYIVDLISKIRAGIPGIALRTTFIVGFPGETEPYFQTLLDFIRETKFERLGVFAYSMAGHDLDAGPCGDRAAERLPVPRRLEPLHAHGTGHGRDELLAARGDVLVVGVRLVPLEHVNSGLRLKETPSLRKSFPIS